MQRFRDSFFQADSFGYFFFFLFFSIRVIAALQSVYTASFIVVVTEHTAHGFLARASDRREITGLDESGNSLLDSFLFFGALRDFTGSKLIYSVPFSTAGFHSRCTNSADSVAFLAVELETFAGFSFLILRNLFET